uniref:Secreted protein n=1 Tax=Steinernema glaseri TaxID=37863 RepID=A0A1I8AT02_9BILA
MFILGYPLVIPEQSKRSEGALHSLANSAFMHMHNCTDVHLHSALFIPCGANYRMGFVLYLRRPASASM